MQRAILALSLIFTRDPQSLSEQRRFGPDFDLSLARHAGPGKEEVCAGWWPGDERHRDAAFYAYGHPKPERIEEARIEREAAEWDVGAGEFLLPYAVVRAAPDPKHAIQQFLESS